MASSSGRRRRRGGGGGGGGGGCGGGGGGGGCGGGGGVVVLRRQWQCSGTRALHLAAPAWHKTPASNSTGRDTNGTKDCAAQKCTGRRPPGKASARTDSVRILVIEYAAMAIRPLIIVADATRREAWAR